VLGAGGRDFHDFATAFRDDPDVVVVAFTAAQIPGIDDRVLPPALAGPRYPAGIPIRPEAELEQLIRSHDVDEVVVAYSDLAHADAMHLVCRALAAGAGASFTGPRRTLLEAPVPVVAVTAARTGSGKSQISRWIAHRLVDGGRRAHLVRHPMPYGDLVSQRVQRFATPADIDAADCTVEEREEYESPVAEGLVMWAGVDYRAIVAAAAAECDVLVWDGGNNDTPFVRPDLHVCVLDPLRAGDELGSFPGEVNLRTADVLVINKVDHAPEGAVDALRRSAAEVNPDAALVEAASQVSLERGPSLAGARVVVVEDGPTLTHGGLAWGAGTVAALDAGAEVVPTCPHAVGEVAAAFDRYPHLDRALPALGYSTEQQRDLAASIDAATRAEGAVAVIAGTPIDLGRLVTTSVPVRRATYRFRQVGGPDLGELVDAAVAAASGRGAATAEPGHPT
jgi:predicted GTPase